MNIINFINRFTDETSCVGYIKEQRMQHGKQQLADKNMGMMAITFITASE